MFYIPTKHTLLVAGVKYDFKKKTLYISKLTPSLTNKFSMYFLIIFLVVVHLFQRHSHVGYTYFPILYPQPLQWRDLLSLGTFPLQNNTI